MNIQVDPIPTVLLQAMSATSLTLVGEIHGTREMPHFVARALDHLRADGQPVRLYLELPRTLQSVFDRFMDTGSYTVFDINELRTLSKFGSWSPAIIQLLDHARSQGLGSASVRLFDVEGCTAPDARDRGMADFLLEQVKGASADTRHLVLCGNIHAMLTVQDGYQPPLGSYLRSALPNILSIKLSHDGGEAWCCLSSRSSNQFRTARHSLGVASQKGTRGVTKQDPDGGAYSFDINVGAVTASYFEWAKEDPVV